MNWQRVELIVGNERGVHGRVATRLAEIARAHKVTLQIIGKNEIVDCSSVLDVLALALVQGTPVVLEVRGEQAATALATAAAVITNRDDP
jgi:phosphotransferase system HPr (HPr) family protein